MNEMTETTQVDAEGTTDTGTDVEFTGCDTIDDRLIEQIAAEEKRPEQFIRERVRAGSVIVMGSIDDDIRPTGIGAGLRTKINANIGTSEDFPEPEDELQKLEVAIEAGADVIMDLSTGGDIDRIRQSIRRECSVPLGTVPVYQAAGEADDKYGAFSEMPADLLFEVIERHAADGVDFQTLHCGVTEGSVHALESQDRVMNIVSRGGSLLARWMKANDRENPLYQQYDRLLEIMKEYDVAISLGDGLRPGAIADASDRGQIAETVVLGELVQRAREAGVQAFVEGPGHMPIDQISGNVMLQKQICDNAPFYVLGPLVTDVAPGYDHITAAIGGAICAAAGADFLCYVTPAEHLGLPTAEDVFEGVMASRIAAHAADIVKNVPQAAEWDEKISRARNQFDWETITEAAIDPPKVLKVRGERPARDPETCSMCGKFCAMKARAALDNSE